MDSNSDPISTLRAACDALLNKDISGAKDIIQSGYRFQFHPLEKRRYSELVKLRLFMRDGFIDRYTGKRLVYIGTLRLLSHWMPDEFPYHSNWKMDKCHPAYWQLAPTLDHVKPIARGGADSAENWVTASMITNAIKANWTLEELGWNLRPPGNLAEWDGLMGVFMQLLDSDNNLKQLKPVSAYYHLVKKATE